jgi:LuxR family transcriptional regulator, maltose regulon positive regulatory protein
VLHRRAAGWFTVHDQVADAVRHTQAAGDWAGAGRLLADQPFSLTLDGQAQPMQALLRAFPPGADHPELALARRHGDLAGVIERVTFLASPVTGPSDEDIALGSDGRRHRT